MSTKRILQILAFILVLAITTGVATYAYLDSRLRANSVPTVEATEETLEVEVAELPEDIEVLSEDEYLQLVEEEDEIERSTTREVVSSAYVGVTSGVDVTVSEAVTTAGAFDVTFEQDDAITEKVEISDRIYNVLLIGDDARINEARGRSDTMILVSYERDTNTVRLLSFMRDMLLPTSLKGTTWSRINGAYAAGGPGRAINLVNSMFSLDVQRYVVVRFASVFALVDQLGGLDVEMTKVEAKVVGDIFPEYGALQEGVNHLNGEQILAFSRMRKVDSDFNRTARQRYVLRTTMSKALETRNVSDLIAMAGFMFENIETNIPLNEVITIGLEVFSGETPTIEELRVPVDGGYNWGRYNGASILTIDFKKNITAIHNYLYGTSVGVKIPRFNKPLMDDQKTDDQNIDDQNIDDQNIDDQNIDDQRMDDQILDEGLQEGENGADDASEGDGGSAGGSVGSGGTGGGGSGLNGGGAGEAGSVGDGSGGSGGGGGAIDADAGGNNNSGGGANGNGGEKDANERIINRESSGNTSNITDGSSETGNDATTPTRRPRQTTEATTLDNIRVTQTTTASILEK